MCIIIYVRTEKMECNLSNVLDVLRRVGYSAAYWKELGRRLVPGLDANSVEVNHRLAQDRLEAVIDAWLRDGDLGEGGDGWRVLAAAVQKCRLGGGRNVAVRILREVETPSKGRERGREGGRPKERWREKERESPREGGREGVIRGRGR